MNALPKSRAISDKIIMNTSFHTALFIGTLGASGSLLLMHKETTDRLASE
jgi:hypothetical protein